MERRPNKPGEVRALVEALATADNVRREAAIARLVIIGARAVERLVAAYPGAERETQAAILRALEPLADPRALPVGVDALRRGGDLSTAAAALLRTLAESERASVSSAALDALMGVALDQSAERHVRAAALHALPPDVRARAAATLDIEARPQDDGESNQEALWLDLTEGRLPDVPEGLREVIARKAAEAPLSTVRRTIDLVRAHEEKVRAASRRAEWLTVRGALHLALAMRGSRVALVDLVDTLAAARGPLPASFLSALQAIGDPASIEAVAAAYQRAPASERGWRDQLAATIQAIVRRERLTRRHAVVKRVAARLPDVPLA